MKLTNRQAHLLLYLLQDTLTMNVHGYLSLSQETRKKLLTDIVNQQGDDMIDLSDAVEKKRVVDGG